MSPESFAATRASLHRVAEHVLAAGQYAAAGTIRLKAVPGGFGTTRPLAGGRRLELVGGRLRVRGPGGADEYAITTLRELAEHAGVPLGLPPDAYAAATPADPDAPLPVDEDDARRLGDWYALADAALRRFAPEAEPVIWPEHFDIGVTVAAVNYGASPGDGEFPLPYLYVGPHAGRPVADEFWNASFGAALDSARVRSVSDALAFFETGRARVTPAGEAGQHG